MVIVLLLRRGGFERQAEVGESAAFWAVGDVDAVEGAKTPAADLKTFQAEAVGAEEGGEAGFVDAERGVDLAAEVVEGAGLLEGFL